MKKFLIGLGVVVVLLLAAVVIVPLVVPVDTYKTRIIALVKQSTGRDLRIDGKIKLSLLPSLELDAEKVAFANAPGAKDPDMAELSELQIQLRLFPLLHGAVELGRFVLVNPVIALEIDKNGRANWDFAPAAGEKTPAAAPAASGGPALSAISLGEVKLSGGKVTYFDQRTGKGQELDDINMSVSLPDLDSRFTATGSAVWNGEKTTLTIDAAKPRALLGGAVSAVDMKLAATPIAFGFTGDVTGLPPAKVAGAIDLTVPSLRGLAKWVGAPITMAGTGLGPLAIKGKVEMAGPKIAFSEADIAIDAIKAKGALALDTGGARPALTGQLAIETLDVNPYLPPEQPGNAASPGASPAAPGAGAAKSSGWSDAPIDVSGLKAADADFDLSASAILYRKIEIGKSVLAIHLKDAKLATTLSEMALYQGKGEGKVSIDGSGAVPAMALSFNLAGVQIEKLAVAATGMDKLSGVGTFNIDATATGKSQRELIGALNGKGALDLANGAIKGVNLIALAKNAASSLTGGSSAGNETDFTSLTGTYTITKGVLHNTDLKLKSNAVPVDGAGTIDLPQQTMDYRVTVSLANAVGVPILVSGPWDNLSYRPDVGAALQGLAKDPGKALDTLKSAVPGAGGTTPSIPGSSLLKGLLGK